MEETEKMTKERLQEILKKACDYCDKPADCVGGCEILADTIMGELNKEKTKGMVNGVKEAH